MNTLVLDEIQLRIADQELFPPLSVRVEPGTVTSIVGASGSGKSSLLKFLCGILPVEIEGNGSVRLNDSDISSLSPQARRLGLLFQEPLLFPHLDVAGNILFGLRTRGTSKERQQQVSESLASVGLAGLDMRDPATLSGGQQARVALLRVLLAEPRALLLDEPFRSLDEDNRVQVRELVFAEARRRGLPTLLVTHDESDVVAAGGPVVRLQDGPHA